MKKAIFIAALACLCLGIYYKKQNKIEPKPIVSEQKIEIAPEPKKEIKKEEPKIVVPTQIKTYEDALIASKALNKPIFLYFGADWCGYCVKMKQTTFVDPNVKMKLKDYVVLMINTDQNPALAKKFKVSGIPAYMVIQSDETITARDTGYKSSIDFLYWLSPKHTTLIEN